jgi:DNA polymerase-3 subunit alpha
VQTSVNDWPFEERLAKEFESIGFFISDHPINEYKEIFDIYKIQNFNSFISSTSNETILAATIMKIQEKKTQKGNPFAIIKFSDLGGVFELFVFSEILDQNRDILNEGKSLLITVIKDISNQANRFKRISVRKLVSLGEISKYSIPKITFEIEEVDNLKKLKDLISERGDTNVKIVVQNNSKNLIFELSKKRKINPKILKSLKNEPYLKRINI